MTLAQTSKNFKLGVKIFIVVAVVYYLFLLVIIPKSKALIRKLVPPKNPPTPIYGQLDSPKFISRPITNKAPRYVLDTKNAELPNNLPNQMVVYKIKRNQFSYLAGTEAEQNAAILGYTKAELTSDLKGDLLTWKSLLSGGELLIKKSTGDINEITNLYGRNDEYRPGNINETSAKTYALALFGDLNRIDDAYNKGLQNVILGRFINNTMYDTVNSNEAQVARVDLFRKIGDFIILGPDPRVGLLNVILRNPTLGGSPFNYPIINVYYHGIDTDNSAKYPVLYVDEAWDQVKNNNGVIVNITPKGANTFDLYNPITIETIYVNKIYLAYYEPEEYTQYLEPVFVFEGKYTTRGTQGGDITLYFPAITKEFIKATPAAK